MLTAVREAQTVEEVSKQVVALAERCERVRARSVRVEDELGNWNLFARCMSNDGLIALAIDDAGPALSALANDLLLACSMCSKIRLRPGPWGHLTGRG